jgi:hypothetical protein
VAIELWLRWGLRETDEREKIVEECWPLFDISA